MEFFPDESARYSCWRVGQLLPWKEGRWRRLEFESREIVGKCDYNAAVSTAETATAEIATTTAQGRGAQATGAPGAEAKAAEAEAPEEIEAARLGVQDKSWGNLGETMVSPNVGKQEYRCNMDGNTTFINFWNL